MTKQTITTLDIRPVFEKGQVNPFEFCVNEYPVLTQVGTRFDFDSEGNPIRLNHIECEKKGAIISVYNRLIDQPFSVHDERIAPPASYYFSKEQLQSNQQLLIRRLIEQEQHIVESLRSSLKHIKSEKYLINLYSRCHEDIISYLQKRHEVDGFIIKFCLLSPQSGNDDLFTKLEGIHFESLLDEAEEKVAFRYVDDVYERTKEFNYFLPKNIGVVTPFSYDYQFIEEGIFGYDVVFLNDGVFGEFKTTDLYLQMPIILLALQAELMRTIIEIEQRIKTMKKGMI